MKYIQIAELNTKGELKNNTLFPASMVYFKESATKNLLVLAGKGYMFDTALVYSEFLKVLHEFLKDPAWIVLDLTPTTAKEIKDVHTTKQ